MFKGVLSGFLLEFLHIMSYVWFICCNVHTFPSTNDARGIFNALPASTAVDESSTQVGV